jgi:WhiB family transcriptional regulator, redox-sensing transcriptional regulator
MITGQERLLQIVVDLRELTWQDDAACGTSDGDAWFPEKGGSTRLAKRVCRSCPVSSQCLEYALRTNEAFGVWGGLSLAERERLQRKQRRAA